MNFKKLIIGLDEQLDQIEKQNMEITQKTKLSITSCEKVLNKMNDFVTSNNFKDKQSEIEFFKEIKVIPLSKLIFYSEILAFEIQYPKANKVEQIKYIEKKIKKINKFYDYNIDFVQYVREDKAHFDASYYTRRNYSAFNFTNLKLYYRTPEFSTSHDILLGKLKGYDFLIIYLQNKLTNLQNPKHQNPDESSLKSNLHWTSSKVDLTELIYAVHSSGVINKGSVKIKDLACAFEQIFNIDIGNYYHIFTEIRARKPKVIKFIERLNNSLIKFIQKSDQ